MDHVDDYMNDISHQFFNNNLQNCINNNNNNITAFSKLYTCVPRRLQFKKEIDRIVIRKLTVKKYTLQK